MDSGKGRIVERVLPKGNADMRQVAGGDDYDFAPSGGFAQRSVARLVDQFVLVGMPAIAIKAMKAAGENGDNFHWADR